MPREFGTNEKDRFVTLVKRGVPPAVAAEQVGFTFATVKRHMKNDVDFYEACEQAALVRDGAVEAVAYDLASSGDHPASTWRWLEAHNPHQYGQRKLVAHTHSGPDGGPIQLASVTRDALREVLTEGDTRRSAVALASELPVIEVEAGDD